MANIHDLTDEQIDAVVAGRETDVLINRTVFGKHDDHYPSMPNYSTDISDAWKVVEKLRETGWVGVTSESTNGGGWICEFQNGLSAIDFCYAETASLAICRAGLKAIKNG